MVVTSPGFDWTVSFHPISFTAGGDALPFRYGAGASDTVGAVSGGTPLSAVQSFVYFPELRAWRLTTWNCTRCRCIGCVSAVMLTICHSSVEPTCGVSVIGADHF